jgi:hypothetical protein
MRHAFIGLCIFSAACSGQTISPTSPSGVAGLAVAQTQASGGAPIEVTFTKWSTGAGIGTGIPTHTGVAGGDVPGTFAGTVITRDPFDNGIIVQLEADYRVIGADPAHSFLARIEGKQNNETQEAVFNGTIIEGWLLGARVHVSYDRIAPCPAFGQAVCFTGIIRVMPGSAS